MAKSKDPAVLFYTSDFLTGTMLMTDDQVGKYIRLLCLQHQKGSLTEKDMLRICIEKDEDIYSKFDKTKHNFYFNKRMLNEAVKRANYSKSRSNNRKKRKIKKKDMKNISKRHVLHMENIDIDIIEDKNSKLIDKKLYKEFIYLSDNEYKKLIDRFGEQGTKDRISDLNNGIGSKGYKYDSHYFTILAWDRKHEKEKKIDESGKKDNGDCAELDKLGTEVN